MDFVEHSEGGTRLLVPAVSLTRDPPPTSPVFFNPAASLNRDISVAMTAALGGSSFCDSMSGVGARGIRVAREVARIETVALVDFNAEALEAGGRAAELNGVEGKCEFSNSETSTYLYSKAGRGERFDFVDVDPFGTPVRQLQAALSATADGGVLSVTATDTAVLCGVYPQVCERRYGAASMRSDFGHETGIRLLAGAIVRQGAQLDVGVRPVFAHSTRHYIRVFLRVSTGAVEADASLEGIGYIQSCVHCGQRSTAATAQTGCASCGRKARVAGPAWVRGVGDHEVLRRARAAADEKGLTVASKAISSLEGTDDLPPWSFSVDAVSSALRVATAPESMVVKSLEDGGWKAKRTPFEKTGIKTDAPYGEFYRAVEGLRAKVRA